MNANRSTAMFRPPANGKNLMAHAMGIGLRTTLTFLLLATNAVPQVETSVTDGTTPLGLAAGSPAGSYALSGFDNINLYNGNLNFRLPLLQVSGRGSATMTITLALNTKSWHVHSSMRGDDGPFNSPVSERSSLESGYGPGLLVGRQTGVGVAVPRTGGPVYTKYTLTRLTFISPDGTEYDLRDALTNGQPQKVGGASRGNRFISTNGEAMTFVSDAPIVDQTRVNPNPDKFPILPSGDLFFRDGTRYRIDGGLVSSIRDRNGNLLRFDYDDDKRVTTITDSLNRQVTILYKVPDVAPYGTCDQITYKGFGGAPRMIRISRGTPLESALRPNSGYSIKTYKELFPELNNASATKVYNPSVVSAAWLPDGRAYRFYYNSYGELARAELPTGGPSSTT